MIGAQTGLSGAEGPFKVSKIDIQVEDRSWAFAEMRQTEIADYFTGLLKLNPTLFNGPMLLADRWAIRGDTFYGQLFWTDFASFLYWRDVHPDGRNDNLADTRNIFGAAAVRSSEGYLLVGEMAAHTANAGRIYGPCGSLDLEDVASARIDIDGAMARELAEETGLDLSLATGMPGYLIWFDGPRVAIVREYRYDANAKLLAARVEAFVAKEPEPELAAIHFLGPNTALEAARMPDYTVAMVRWLFYES
ncbi:hypothetical protein MNBD_ALPHA09-549 [hydrothermal vent metagenome]|uniref:Nudix hydrolase domain-containing protein n=1 Tax=hydrothermal vent metagenome TaxID=652676 RepID=A0A3B0TCG6_9ZZZZ